jgi:hypothetical protein
MSLPTLFLNPTLKPKQKTEAIAQQMLKGQVSEADWLAFARLLKDPAKATCIEAMEIATQVKPELLTQQGFDYVVEQLSAKAPRIKWESAKVIANTAQNFEPQLDMAIVNLLDNAEHIGTVVRWSAAKALAAIVALKTKHNSDLIPALEVLCLKEEKGSIQKIYKAGLKKGN